MNNAETKSDKIFATEYRLKNAADASIVIAKGCER